MHVLFFNKWILLVISRLIIYFNQYISLFLKLPHKKLLEKLIISFIKISRGYLRKKMLMDSYSQAELKKYSKNLRRISVLASYFLRLSATVVQPNSNWHRRFGLEKQFWLANWLKAIELRETYCCQLDFDPEKHRYR